VLLGAARDDCDEFNLHTARRPRPTRVMAYSGAFLCASSEPLVIR